MTLELFSSFVRAHLLRLVLAAAVFAAAVASLNVNVASRGPEYTLRCNTSASGIPTLRLFGFVDTSVVTIDGCQIGTVEIEDLVGRSNVTFDQCNITGDTGPGDVVLVSARRTRTDGGTAAAVLRFIDSRLHHQTIAACVAVELNDPDVASLTLENSTIDVSCQTARAIAWNPPGVQSRLSISNTTVNVVARQNSYGILLWGTSAGIDASITTTTVSVLSRQGASRAAYVWAPTADPVVFIITGCFINATSFKKSFGLFYHNNDGGRVELLNVGVSASAADGTSVGVSLDTTTIISRSTIVASAPSEAIGVKALGSGGETVLRITESVLRAISTIGSVRALEAEGDGFGGNGVIELSRSKLFSMSFSAASGAIGFWMKESGNANISDTTVDVISASAATGVFWLPNRSFMLQRSIVSVVANTPSALGLGIHGSRATPTPQSSWSLTIAASTINVTSHGLPTTPTYNTIAVGISESVNATANDRIVISIQNGSCLAVNGQSNTTAGLAVSGRRASLSHVDVTIHRSVVDVVSNGSRALAFGQVFNFEHDGNISESLWRDVSITLEWANISVAVTEPWQEAAVWAPPSILSDCRVSFASTLILPASQGGFTDLSSHVETSLITSLKQIDNFTTCTSVSRYFESGAPVAIEPSGTFTGTVVLAAEECAVNVHNVSEELHHKQSVWRLPCGPDVGLFGAVIVDVPPNATALVEGCYIQTHTRDHSTPLVLRGNVGAGASFIVRDTRINIRAVMSTTMWKSPVTGISVDRATFHPSSRFVVEGTTVIQVEAPLVYGIRSEAPRLSDNVTVDVRGGVVVNVTSLDDDRGGAIAILWRTMAELVSSPNTTSVALRFEDVSIYSTGRTLAIGVIVRDDTLKDVLVEFDNVTVIAEGTASGSRDNSVSPVGALRVVCWQWDATSAIAIRSSTLRASSKAHAATLYLRTRTFPRVQIVDSNITTHALVGTSFLIRPFGAAYHGPQTPAFLQVAKSALHTNGSKHGYGLHFDSVTLPERSTVTLSRLTFNITGPSGAAFVHTDSSTTHTSAVGDDVLLSIDRCAGHVMADIGAYGTDFRNVAFGERFNLALESSAITVNASVSAAGGMVFFGTEDTEQPNHGAVTVRGSRLTMSSKDGAAGCVYFARNLTGIAITFERSFITLVSVPVVGAPVSALLLVSVFHSKYFRGVIITIRSTTMVGLGSVNSTALALPETVQDTAVVFSDSHVLLSTPRSPVVRFFGDLARQVTTGSSLCAWRSYRSHRVRLTFPSEHVMPRSTACFSPTATMTSSRSPDQSLSTTVSSPQTLSPSSTVSLSLGSASLTAETSPIATRSHTAKDLTPSATIPKVERPAAVPAVAEVAEEAVATTAAVTTSAAFVGGGVVAATQASRALSIVALAQCSAGAVLHHEPQFPEALFPGFAIGDDVGSGRQAALHRGVVIGNVIAILAIFSLATAAWATASFILMRVRLKQNSRTTVVSDVFEELEQSFIDTRAAANTSRLSVDCPHTGVAVNPSDVAAHMVPDDANASQAKRLGESEATFAGASLRVSQLVKYPSSALLVPMGLALDGVCGSTAALLRLTDSPFDFVLAIAALLLISGLFAAGLYVVLAIVPRRCTVVDTESNGVLRRLRDGDTVWAPSPVTETKEDQDGDVSFIARWSLLFFSYRRPCRWFYFVDALSAVAVAFARGGRSDTEAGCRAALIASALILTAIVGAGAVLRPFVSPLRNAASLLSASLLALSAVVATIATALPSDTTAQRRAAAAAGHLALAAAMTVVVSPIATAWRVIDQRLASSARRPAVPEAPTDIEAARFDPGGHDAALWSGVMAAGAADATTAHQHDDIDDPLLLLTMDATKAHTSNVCVPPFNIDKTVADAGGTVPAEKLPGDSFKPPGGLTHTDSVAVVSDDDFADLLSSCVDGDASALRSGDSAAAVVPGDGAISDMSYDDAPATSTIGVGSGAGPNPLDSSSDENAERAALHRPQGHVVSGSFGVGNELFTELHELLR